MVGSCVGNVINVAGTTSAIGIKVVEGTIVTLGKNTVTTTILSNVIMPGAGGYAFAAWHLAGGAYGAYRAYRAYRAYHNP